MTRTPKTSLTHPLPLPAVTTPGGGAIAITMCPGKRQPEAVTGPWDRDLTLDLDAMAAFGATTVVTLMETDELKSAATPVALLRGEVEKRGWTWLHWPISDFAAPGPEFEVAWKVEAPVVVKTLAAGGRVVVHCRGGRGRSGLVAARLLIEMGIDSLEAIKAVREAQPLAIETPPQEAHVRDYKPKG